MTLLSVSGLNVRYGESKAVDGLSFRVEPGEAVGLVGESGSGKTQTALALMGLSPSNARVTGSVKLAGTEIVGAADSSIRRLRGTKMSMVFQDPSDALNPHLRVGDQIARILISHGLADGSAARRAALDALARVRLPDPERQYRAWPHELSGGMRQRAMIAAALIAKPDLLIADEPTTALDVTVQARILDLLDEIREDTCSTREGSSRRARSNPSSRNPALTGPARCWTRRATAARRGRRSTAGRSSTYRP